MVSASVSPSDRYPPRVSSIRGPVRLPDDIVPAWANHQARSYLQGRGLTKERVASYDLQFCSKGYMAQRIIIPIYADDGSLVAYQGRSIDPNEPTRYVTQGSRPLYRPWDISDRDSRQPLLIVEGFFDLVVADLVLPTVATLGVMVSPPQLAEILALLPAGFPRVLIWYDAGAEEEAFSLKLRLRPFISTDVVLSAEKDPGSMTLKQAQEVLHGV